MNDKIENHILEKFEILELKGKGAYGYVWKVKDKKNNKIYALKKIFEAFQNITDAQRTYREVIYLNFLNNYESIIKIISVFKSINKRDLYLLFEYMETDLHLVIRSNILLEIHKKFIIFQIIKAVKYIHSANIIHRDLKPSNILINSDCLIKIADFGLSRSWNFEEFNYSVTENIATRWYRAPEILFQSKYYGKEVDLWSIGCILAEILLGKVIFNGSSSKNQIELIIELLGKPSNNDLISMKSPHTRSFLSELKIKRKKDIDKVFENCDEDGLDLLKKLFKYNPNERITLDECLKHSYFKKFYNPNEIINHKGKLENEIKDFEKLTVKEYRNEIYKIIDNSNSISKPKLKITTKEQNTLTNNSSSKKRLISKNKFYTQKKNIYEINKIFKNTKTNNNNLITLKSINKYGIKNKSKNHNNKTKKIKSNFSLKKSIKESKEKKKDLEMNIHKIVKIYPKKNIKSFGNINNSYSKNNLKKTFKANYLNKKIKSNNFFISKPKKKLIV